MTNSASDELVERIRQWLTYDPLTGVCRWKVDRISGHGKRQAVAGQVAGSLSKVHGYVIVTIEGRGIAAHQIAWLLSHGRWPAKFIDHINGVRNDNRLCNLREATHSQNCQNAKLKSTNTTGAKGVYRSGINSWGARIRHNGTLHNLGIFPSIAEASQAYTRAAERLHREFMRAG